jgi:hypothetical protein
MSKLGRSAKPLPSPSKAGLSPLTGEAPLPEADANPAQTHPNGHGCSVDVREDVPQVESAW